MKKLILLLLGVFVMLVHGNAQNKFIQGVVHTFDSIPLIGAEVLVKSTGKSYFTNTKGNFFVECNTTDKLKIKAEGFSNQNIKITEKVKIVAVNLKPKAGSSNRSLAIGYGKINEKDNSAAVSNINNSDTEFSKYLNVYDLIRDNFAGVQVVNNEIIVRGSTSFMSSNAALIIIDGVISDGEVLESISPLEIKEINIIKDGSAAVYGSRGSNGVVILETKKGGEI